MKDNFSQDSDNYARYRPTYPQELYDFLYTNLASKEKAWDCATGTGQVAKELANYFTEVQATDISKSQLKEAPKRKNIHYSLQSAEASGFNNKEFDLITVGQAIHWFNFEKFFKEAKRCLKPNGILAIFGYGLLKISSEIDVIIFEFYEKIIGPFWDEERKYIEDEYKTIPFPLEEINTPEFSIQLNWSVEDLLHYLNTWSAVKHYENSKNENPLKHIENKLKSAYGTAQRKITFPIIIKVGRKT
jgi:ubiquinone/menaquinone biosynthesis C-methylase UbiE